MPTPNPGIMTHMVFDMETLGTRDSAVILSFGAIIYNLKTDASKSIHELVLNKSFHWKFSAKEQIEKYKRTVDQDVLDWWKNQSDDARKILLPSEKDGSVADFFIEFEAWSKGLGYQPHGGISWARGNTDIGWHDSLSRCVGKNHADDRVLDWRRSRDIRTAVDALGWSTKFNGIPDGFYNALREQFPEKINHDALHDCGAQVLQLRLCGVFPSADEFVTYADDDIPF